MNKLFTYLLPFAALCGAVAILSNRPEAASSESELPKATPNTFKVSVPSIVDRNLTDNLSADSLVQNTQVPDLRALAAASKSLLDNAQLGPQLTQLTSGLDQLKAQLDGLSKQEGSATKQLNDAKARAQWANEEIADCKLKLKSANSQFKRNSMKLDEVTDGKPTLMEKLDKARAQRRAILEKVGNPTTQKIIIERNQEMLDREEYIVYRGNSPVEYRPMTPDKRKEIETALKKARDNVAEQEQLEAEIESLQSELQNLGGAEKALAKLKEAAAVVEGLKARQNTAIKTLERATADSKRLQQSIEDAYRTKRLLSLQIKTREDAIAKLKDKKVADSEKAASK